MRGARRSKGLALLLLFCLYSTSVWGQNERFKALFLYNFTRYLEWPQEGQQGDFVILVIGQNSAITRELQQIAGKKKVGGRTLVVRETSDASDVSHCNMVYVPSSERSLLPRVVAAASGRPVVVVSDAAGGIAQGAAFNFTEDGGKTQFEVRPSTLEKQGVKVSNSLLSLGVVK